MVGATCLLSILVDCPAQDTTNMVRQYQRHLLYRLYHAECTGRTAQGPRDHETNTVDGLAARGSHSTSSAAMSAVRAALGGEGEVGVRRGGGGEEHLSLLKKPQVAVEMMDRRVHSSWSLYTLSTSSCAPPAPYYCPLRCLTMRD